MIIPKSALTPNKEANLYTKLSYSAGIFCSSPKLITPYFPFSIIITLPLFMSATFDTLPSRYVFPSSEITSHVPSIFTMYLLLSMIFSIFSYFVSNTFFPSELIIPNFDSAFSTIYPFL